MDETNIRYVWIDEDDNPVSPRHSTFKAAVSYINSYSMRKKRIASALLRAKQYDNEYQMRRSQEALEELSKTGKDPAGLRRLVEKVAYDNPSDDEQRVVDLFLPIGE